MRIGVKIGPADGPDVRAAAEQAERLGFDSVWLSERVVTPLDKPHPYQPMVDPWIALAYVAAVTDHVRLGTSVSQIALRHPVLMARELATLDRLSGGRLIAGAGAGWVAEEFTSTDVSFDDRGGRLNEVLRLLRHLWTTPERPWQGKYFKVPPVGIVRPLTAGGPPIFLGAITEAGLRRAARYGDGFISVGAMGQPLERMAGTIRRIQELRDSYGRSDPFAFYAQVSAPESVDTATEMLEAYGSIGVDGLILTYTGSVPGAFVAAKEAARALIDGGAAR